MIRSSPTATSMNEEISVMIASTTSNSTSVKPARGLARVIELKLPERFTYMPLS